MSAPRIVIGALAGGLAGVAVRALLPARAPSAGPAVDDREPVLGYDGMDRDTLLEWLERAGLDPETLERIRTYEGAHRARESVLQRLGELLEEARVRN